MFIQDGYKYSYFEMGVSIMKNKYFKNIFFLILMTFFSVFTFNSKSTTAEAANPTINQVYAAAPEGLNLSQYLSLPAVYGDNTPNNAVLIPANSTYNNKSDIIQMLSVANTSTTQISSFWGHRPGDTDSKNETIATADNYFDLTKRQTISAWLYLGENDPYSGLGSDSDTTVRSLADGMAFVLQADSRGSKAISTAVSTGKTAAGETLGVWGAAGANGGTLTSSYILGNGAIKNSFALEFDTLQNDTAAAFGTSTDDFFDALKYGGTKQAKGEHIAWNYPATLTMGSGTAGASPSSDANTYYGATYSRNNYYGMVHRDAISNMYISGYGNSNTVDQSWKHFTFEYTPPAANSTVATISYYFNDKAYDGTIKPFSQMDRKVNRSIDISKFVASGTKEVRWGFTAATGSPKSGKEDFAAIMQEMPNVANIDSTTKLYDLSQYNTDGTKGREISDLEKRADTESTNLPKFSVANNDKLRFDYNLNYLSGFAGSGSNITTTIILPKDVDFSADNNTILGKAGNIGQIIYTGFANSSANQTIPIAASDVTTDSSGNQIVKISLNKMDTAGQKVTVQLFGKASSTTTPKTVLGQHASYKSNNYIDDNMSPSFIIRDQLQATATDSQLIQTIDYGGTATLGGTLKYANGSNFDGKDATLHIRINGVNQGSGTIATTTSASTTFTTKADGSILKVGDNTIEIYAIDSMNRVSNTLTYKIKVNDYKTLNLTATGNTTMTVQKSEDTQLNSTLKYSNSDAIKLSEMTGYIKIDDGDYQKVLLSGDDSVNPATVLYKIAADTLTLGTHTVAMYVNDGVRSSNTIIYTLDVTDKHLILVPDQNEVTVSNNEPVTITGKFHFSDDSDITGIVKRTYELKNGEYPVQDATGTMTSGGDTYSFTINPIARGKNVVNGDVDAWLADPANNTGLRVGRNEVNITVLVAGKYTATATVVINVPDIDINLATDKSSFNVVNFNPIKFPLTFQYSDPAYELNRATTKYYAGLVGNDQAVYGSVSTYPAKPTTSEEPIAVDPTKDQTDLGTNAASGPTPYHIAVYSIDDYGRKSNTVDYYITVMEPEAKLTVDKSYRFKNMVFGEGGDTLIKRDGAWTVKVTSYKSPWKLTATGGQFTTKDSDGTVHQMVGEMLFVDDLDHGFSLNDTTIAFSDNTTAKQITTDIGGSWKEDQGILLKSNSYEVSGEYQSSITWSLTNSL